jgi:hypothetical protein
MQQTAFDGMFTSWILTSRIIVRDGKGEYVTMLPASLAQPLQQHLARVKRQHDHDLTKGYGYVECPGAQISERQS